MAGLLDALTDPVLMAVIEEHNRVVARIAQQMGVTHEQARQALSNFEILTTSEGQSVH